MGPIFAKPENKHGTQVLPGLDCAHSDAKDRFLKVKFFYRSALVFTNQWIRPKQISRFGVS